VTGASGVGTVTFTNAASGIVRAAAPSGPVTLGSLGIPGGTANYLDFTNAGRIDVVSGTLQINTGFSGATGGGTFASTGIIDVASGATVQFGGQASLASSATLSGAGSLLTSLGANLVSDGTVSLGGTMTLAAGTATFNSSLAPSTLAVTGGTALFRGSTTPGGLTITGGTSTFTGHFATGSLAASGGAADFTGGAVVDTISITAGTVLFNNTSSANALTLSGGTLGGTGGGGLTLNGASTWSGGTFAGNLRVATGQTLSLTGARKSFGAGTITNDGTIASSHTALAIIDIVGDGTVNNNGLFDVQSDLFFGDQGTSLGTLTFVNAATGELRVSGGTTSTIGSEGAAAGTENYVLFANAGTVDVRSGLLQVNVGLNGGAEGGSFANTPARFSSRQARRCASAAHSPPTPAPSMWPRAAPSASSAASRTGLPAP
jgi:fibronectin-binding autotransporter adhesin